MYTVKRDQEPTTTSRCDGQSCARLTLAHRASDRTSGSISAHAETTPHIMPLALTFSPMGALFHDAKHAKTQPREYMSAGKPKLFISTISGAMNAVCQGSLLGDPQAPG